MARMKQVLLTEKSPATAAAVMHLLFLVQEARVEPGAMSLVCTPRIQGGCEVALTVTYNPLPGCCPQGCPLHYTTHGRLLSEITRRVSPTLRGEVLTASIHTAVNKAVALTDLLAEFYVDQGTSLPPEGRSFLLSLLSAYALAELAEAYLKFKFSYIAAQALQQTELPGRPLFLSHLDRSDVLVGGALYNWHRRAIHGLNLQLGQTMSQLKKGAPEVSKTLLSEACEKTLKALSSERASNTPVVEEVLVPQVIRTAKELFAEGWYTGKQAFAIPSGSAHFDVARKEGGAFGQALKSAVGDESAHAQEVTYAIPLPKGDSLSAFVRWLLMPPLRSPSLWDHDLAAELPFAELIVKGLGYELIQLPEPSVDRMWKQIYNRRTHREELLYLARPLALAEPFKVRTITLGPSSAYYRAKYIQKAVHGHLRMHPCATLVGRTLNSEILNRNLWVPKEDEFYVSGDYTAATDNLDPRLSEAAGRTIAERGRFSEEWTEIFIKSLTKHHMFDFAGFKKVCRDRGVPAENTMEALRNWAEGGPEDPVISALFTPQAWGQLMGSPTSFPILCLVNLALTRYSQELTYQRAISLRDSGILINGDDIGFVTNAEGYENWKKITSSGGLAPSLGKNFTSTSFIVLNSMMQKCNPEPGQFGPRSFEEVAYVNYGLVHGGGWRGSELDGDRLEEAVMARDEAEGAATVSALARELIRGHPEEMQKSLMKRFLRTWQPILTRLLPRGMSYYLPQHLGGLGLPWVGDTDKEKRLSRAQRQMASHLMHDPERQTALATLAGASRSLDFRLWQKAQPILRRTLSGVPRIFVRRALALPDPPAMAAVTSACLQEAMMGTDYSEVCPDLCTLTKRREMEATKLTSWKRSYETLFDQVMRGTFPPATDSEIESDLPFRAEWILDHDFETLGRQNTVDLRHPPPLPAEAPLLERIFAAA